MVDFVRVLTLLERIPALDCEFKVRGQGTRPFGAEGTRSRRDAGWRGCASRGGQCCSPHKRVYNRALLCVYLFVRGPAAAAPQPLQPAVVKRRRGHRDTPVLEQHPLPRHIAANGRRCGQWSRHRSLSTRSTLAVNVRCPPADSPENKFLVDYLVIRYIRTTYCPKSLSSVLIPSDIL